MSKPVPDKNIEINGQTVGANTTVKLSVKTAMWIIGAIVGLVMGILTYSYFDLKQEVAAADAAAVKAQKEFVEKVDGKLDELGETVHSIDKSVGKIETNIDHILGKQVRDNPVVPNPNRTVTSTAPPVE